MMLTYFVENKLGGVTSLNYNLVAHGGAAVRQRVIHMDENETGFAKAEIHYPAGEEVTFNFSIKDNYYYTLKRLRRLAGATPGAFVLNDYNELDMLDLFPGTQTTYQLVHDSYNVKLAGKFHHVIDVFICHNTVIHQALLTLLPERKKDIFYLPHGVPVPRARRVIATESGGILKLVFLGRMVQAKGIFDLPVISALLRERGVRVQWLCIGNGPELDVFKKAWNVRDEVSFVSPKGNDEVIALCATQDVFVLPTKFEGSPVSLLETMSVGLVPVVSKIAGGITDIVHADIGFAVPVDDNRAFADSIEFLYRNPQTLNTLSANCRRKIEAAFDVTKTAAAYHALFLRYEEFYKKKHIGRYSPGARLDRPFIPNFLTRFLRTILSV